jgi:PAS domain S-box-containing protein
MVDTDLTYVLANPAGAELAGCTQEELIGTPIAETFVPEDRPLLLARMEMMKTEPYLHFERKFVRKNGDIVPVEVSVTTIRGRYLQAGADSLRRYRNRPTRERPVSRVLHAKRN